MNQTNQTNKSQTQDSKHDRASATRLSREHYIKQGQQLMRASNEISGQKGDQFLEATRGLYQYLQELHEESKRAVVSIEDESLLNFHIGLVLKKVESHSPTLKVAATEHCNFVYMALLLLFKNKTYPQHRDNRKSAEFILENIIENTFILMQGEASLLERRPKFKSNRFGSIFEFRRVCNTCSLLSLLPLIKQVEHSQVDERGFIDELMRQDAVPT